MAQNIEIKARCNNLVVMEKQVRTLTAKRLGKDHQTDTFFLVPNGRFKLRESLLDGAYLIPYFRADDSGPRSSLYAKIRVEEPKLVKNIFSRMFDVHTIVKKKRTIYIYKNVRIHLDVVNNLGTFIELEAVMDAMDSDVEINLSKVQKLMNVLNIQSKDLIADSYETLSLQQNIQPE